MSEQKTLSGAKGGSGSSSSATDTLRANNVYRGVYLVSEGPIEGFVNGGKDIYLNDVPIIDSNGNPNFEGVNWTIREGLADQAHISGFDSVYSPVEVDQEVLFSNPIEVTVAGNYDAVAVTVMLPGLYRISDSGETKGEDVQYAIEVKANGSGSWITAQTEFFKYQKVTSEYEKTYRVDLPDGGSPWLVRVRRITADSTNDHIFNKTFFSRYDTIVDGKYSYPNFALLAVEVNAKQFGNEIPKVSGKPKGLKIWVPKNYNPATRTYATSGAGTSGGIWDGTFKAAYSDNPVWIYFDLVTNNRYGLGQSLNPDNNLNTVLADKWNLYTISQYCDEMVSDGKGGEEPRFTLNAKIDTKDSAYNVLRDVSSVFRGMLYWASNQIFVGADIPYSPQVTFNQTDVEGGVFNYAGTPLKTRSTCVIVRWKNPTNLWKEEVEVVEDYEAIYQLGYREKTLTGFGITSRGQARRLAKWLLLTEKMQTQTLTFTAGWKGATLFPGMIVNIADPYKAGLRAGGRVLGITEVGANTDFTIDSPFEIENAIDYFFTVVLPDGTTELREIINADGVTNTIRVAGHYDEPPIEGAVYVITSDDLGLQQYRVINVKETDRKYEVFAAQHYPNKYAEIEEGPEFDIPPTTIIDTGQLPVPSNVVVTKWYSPVQGSEVRPRITVSWKKPDDNRISRFELQVKTNTTAWTTVYRDDGVSWDSEELQVTSGTDYQARVRSVGLLGNFSPWAYSSEFTIEGKGTIPPAPTNYSAVGIIRGLAVNWDNPVLSDFKHVEVWAGDVNNLALATKIAEVSDDFYILSDVTVAARVYFWLKTVTYATTNNTSLPTPSFNAVAKGIEEDDINDGSISITKLADTITAPEIVASLPVVGNYEGRLVYLTTNGKLYRYHSGAWTAEVPFIDLVGTIAPFQFASDMVPPQIVATLPTTGNFQGRTVFLTTDNKLYRYNGTAFTAAVPTTDLSGTLADAQIAAVAASKITGTMNDSQLAAISAAKITGTVNSSQIAAGAIIAGKIAADAVTANEIAANSITASELAANSVTAAKIQAGQIQSGHLVAGAVDSDKIAANTITAGMVQSDAITANKIQAGAITAGKIAAGSISATEIAASTITGDRIAAGTITGGNISANTITSGLIQANAITAGKLAADAVTAGTIAAAAIGAREIATDAITAIKIAADSITTNKITIGGVTTDRIGTNGVTNSALVSMGGSTGISGSETTLCSMTYGSEGGALDITYQCAYSSSGTTGTHVGLYMRLYVDGGLLSEVPFLCPNNFTDIRSIAASWQPGSGSHTLELRMFQSGGSGSPTALQAQILLVERKR